MEPGPGVQNERTALAWQRTALSLLAGSAIVSRLAMDRLGLAALACVAVALPVTLWILRLSRARYRQHVKNGRASLRDGTSPAYLTAVTVAMLVTELVAIARGA